ncbi:MAG: MFS transporter [Clostridia bacterium]|nr:MFS transporter [Clostridia bacterium]
MKQRQFATASSGRLVFLCLLLGYVVVSMSKATFSSAMVFIVNEGTLTKLETGNITSVFYVSYALLQVVGGLAVDRYRPERFMAVGLLGAGLCNLVVYFTQNYAVLLVTWILNGALQFGIWPAVFKICSTMLLPAQRETSLAIAGCCLPLGTLGASLLAALVSDWRDTFLVAALLLIASALVFSVGFASCRRDVMEVEVSAAAPRSREGKTVGVRTWLLSSGLILVLVIAFVRSALESGFRSLTPTMINESYAGVSPSLATVLNLIVLAASAGGTFLSHVLHARLFRNEGAAFLALFLTALPLVAVPLFVGRVSYWAIVLSLAGSVLLCSAASFFTTLVAMRFNRLGKGGAVAGIMNALAALGISFSNTVFTATVEATGWRGAAVFWVVLVALLVLAAAAFLPLWRRFKRGE